MLVSNSQTQTLVSWTSLNRSFEEAQKYFYLEGEGVPDERSRRKQAANCRDSSDQGPIKDRDLFSMKFACLEVFRISPGFAIHGTPGVDSFCQCKCQWRMKTVKDAAWILVKAGWCVAGGSTLRKVCFSKHCVCLISSPAGHWQCKLPG